MVETFSYQLCVQIKISGSENSKETVGTKQGLSKRMPNLQRLLLIEVAAQQSVKNCCWLNKVAPNAYSLTFVFSVFNSNAWRKSIFTHL